MIFGQQANLSSSEVRIQMTQWLLHMIVWPIIINDSKNIRSILIW